MKYLQYIEHYLDNAMSMDLRHAKMIKEFVSSLEGITKYIEVGCCYGISTASFLEASIIKNTKCILIDPSFQSNLVKMCENYNLQYSDQLSMYEDYSFNVLDKVVDSESIVLLDGDHRLSAVKEEINILEKYKPRAIILHDVLYDDKYCDGPKWAFDRLCSIGYYGIIDGEERQSERTHRGLGILCKTPEDHCIAKSIILHS
jgi:hypothetical protein